MGRHGWQQRSHFWSPQPPRSALSSPDFSVRLDHKDGPEADAAASQDPRRAPLGGLRRRTRTEERTEEAIPFPISAA